MTAVDTAGAAVHAGAAVASVHAAAVVPTAVIAAVLLAICALIALALNNIWTRIALVEVILNEGLPPGLSPRHNRAIRAQKAHELLGAGVHIFLSKHCRGCRRFLTQLENALAQTEPDGTTDTGIGVDTLNMKFYFLDQPNSEALKFADYPNISFCGDVETNLELSEMLAATPLPYAFAIGAHSLGDHGPIPDLEMFQEIVNNAGIRTRLISASGPEKISL